MVLLDNCASQKTPLTRMILKHLGIDVIIIPHTSFLSAPVEKIFGALKRRDHSKISTNTIRSHLTPSSPVPTLREQLISRTNE